jgi:hypothetical protein
LREKSTINRGLSPLRRSLSNVFDIEVCNLPEGSLLMRQRAQGAFTDCHVSGIARAVTLSEYIAAFYTTRLFKLERMVLRWAVSRPSTDLEVQSLAAAQIDHFAAWVVESRTADQILLADYMGRTKSWLMTKPAGDTDQPGSLLYFGSAVLPIRDRDTGNNKITRSFSALLPFHKAYSRSLLLSARRRLESQA